MKIIALGSAAAIAILALMLTACNGSTAQTPAPVPAAATAQDATSAKIAQIHGRTLEYDIENQELDCEYKLIGKTSRADAHEFCHDSSRSDWEEWAIKYPELAKAREATR